MCGWSYPETWVPADSEAGLLDTLWTCCWEAGRGGDSRAEEAGALSDSARCLPRRKGSGPGVRAPGPSAAPREYLLCSLSGTDNGLDWEGLGGGNLISDSRLFPRPFLLPGCWMEEEV